MSRWFHRGGSSLKGLIWATSNVKTLPALWSAYYQCQFQSIRLWNGLKLRIAGANAIKYLYAIFGKKIYGSFNGVEKTVVDIGANYGFFSIFAALHTGSNCRIFALEPSPDSFKILSENIRENRYDHKITAIEKAVTGSTNTVQLALPGNALCHNLYNFKNSENHVEVQTITLPELVQQFGLDTIDILKLNCEGAEYDILLNLSPAVLKKIREIRMEYHQVEIVGKRFEVQQLITFLDNNDFEIVRFLPVHPRHGIIWFKR